MLFGKYKPDCLVSFRKSAKVSHSACKNTSGATPFNLRTLEGARGVRPFLGLYPKIFSYRYIKSTEYSL